MWLALSLQCACPCSCGYIGEYVELSVVLSLPCIVLHLPCLCESSFVAFSFSHPTPTPNSKTSRPNAPDAHPFRTAPLAKTHVKLTVFGLVKLPLLGLVKLPLFRLVKLPLFGLLASAYTLLHGFLSPTPARTSTLSSPEPGQLHLEVPSS